MIQAVILRGESEEIQELTTNGSKSESEVIPEVTTRDSRSDS